MLVGVLKVFDVERHFYGSIYIVFILNYIIESLMYDRENVQMVVLTCATCLMIVCGEERKGSERAASLSEYGRRRVGNSSLQTLTLIVPQERCGIEERVPISRTMGG